MDSELELKKSRATVSVFVNGMFLMSKYFKIRTLRCKWMEEVAYQLRGVGSMYFQVRFEHSLRKEPKHVYEKGLKEEHRRIVTESIEEEKKIHQLVIIPPIIKDSPKKKKT